MVKIEIAFENFHFWEFFILGRLPMRIRPPEKSLCFSTFFEYAFEPSTIKGSAFPTVPLFECAFEPSFPLERASKPWFPSSFHLFNSAPSSPIMTILKNPRISITMWPSGQVTHYNVTIFEKSSYFSTGQVTHYNVTTFEKSSYFSFRAGNPLQWKIFIFFH